MKNANTAFAVLTTLTTLTLAPRSAHAVHRDEPARCVPRTPLEVHSHVASYNNYKNLDNGIRRNMGAPFGELQLINMISSTANYSEIRFNGLLQLPLERVNTNAVVWVVLQPYRLTSADTGLFPRFFLHCTSTWDADGTDAFTHICDWVAPPYVVNGPIAQNPVLQAFDWTHRPMEPITNSYFNIYGLGSEPPSPGVAFRGFHTQLRVTQNDNRLPSCGSGSSLLEYSFDIEPNGSQMVAIRDKVLEKIAAQFPFLPESIITAFGRRTVEPLFNENNPDNFFIWYYAGFYRAWAQPLSSPR